MEADDPLTAAVRAFALHDAGAITTAAGLLKPVTRLRLDSLVGTAHHFGHPDLAACLLILALAEDRPGGAAVCLAALKHAAAELELPLPLTPRCEHGVPDGDWCDPCNREYKDARKEAP